MRVILSVLCVVFSISSFSQDKYICVTVDDLPVVNYGLGKGQMEKITHDLVRTFVDHGIPAMGFVNEKKMFYSGKLDIFQQGLLEHWLKNGLELGNHGFGHLNYHRVSFETYTQDIIKGEKISKDLCAKYGKVLDDYRHPFLRVGLTKAKHDSLTAFLAKHGYREAPVTIDNDDYLFAKAYHNAFVSKNDALMKKIADDYVAYMEEKLLYFEESSVKLLGKNIKHTLLIHANKLNADHFKDLVKMYISHGYQFISLDTALADPLYQQEITRYGDWGISWIDRWALSQGKKGAFFKGDPPTPQYIKDLAAN